MSTPPDSPDVVTSLYVWGPNRDEVNRLATRAAQGMDPRFAWVEVSDAAAGGLPPSDPERGLAAPAHAFSPAPGISEQRMWTYLQPNGQRGEAQELDSFVRMSEPIQRAIEHLLQRDRPRVLVVANLERLLGLFCKDDAVPHPFIEWLNAHEITLVASSTGKPLHEGVFFDYLITQPDSASGAARPPIVAVCQRGDQDSSFLHRIFDPHDVVSIVGPSPATGPGSTSSRGGTGG